MASSQGPILALLQIPAEWRSDIEAAFGRVWTGRLVHAEHVDALPEPPALGIIAAHRVDDLFRIAALEQQRSPDTVLLAITEAARPLRSRRDGVPSNVPWTLSPRELEDARLLGIAMRFVLEVGACRGTERRLQALLPMSERGYVASATAHALVNPLMSLLTNLELARLQLGIAVAGGEGVHLPLLLGIVTDALEAARHLVQVASDLGRASGRSGRVVAVDVGSVLDTACRLTARTLAGIEIRRVGRRTALALVDQTRLCQVFLNLLRNAAQGLQDQAAPWIEIRLEQEDDEVAVWTSDNGSGIGGNIVDRLFDPGSTTRAGGTGLGLALCRQYLTEMSGTIALSRTSPAGTTFEIRLRAAPRVSEGPTLVPEEGRETARILVVDDVYLIQQAIARVLVSTHEVHTAATPSEAMQLLEENPRYDLLLIDLHLREQSGLDFYEQLVQHYPALKTKVVFLSGAFDPKTLAYLEQNEVPWMCKPFGAEELRALVSTVLSTRSP